MIGIPTRPALLFKLAPGFAPGFALAVALAAALALGPGGSAQAQSQRAGERRGVRAPAAAERETPDARAAEGGGSGSAPDSRAEVREALKAFYLHELTVELGLSADRAASLEAPLQGLLDAHRMAGRERLAAGLVVRRAANGVGDPSAALQALEDSETDGRARIAAARHALLADLTPREQARFVGFEDTFRKRVRDLLKSGSEPAPGMAGDAAGDAARDAATGMAGDAARAEGGGFRDTMRLVFVHEVRLELGLDDARTLALLGPLDALLAARQQGDRSRRAALDQLRVGAHDDAATPATLSALMKNALDADVAANASLIKARRTLLATLSPREGCQFILAEMRFLAGARRQMREAGTLRERFRSGQRSQQGAGRLERPPGSAGALGDGD